MAAAEAFTLLGVLVARSGSSVLFGLANTEQGNDAEDRLQDVEPGMGSVRRTPPPSWHGRQRPRGTPLREAGGSSPHYDGYEQLEPGHSAGQPIGFRTDTGASPYR
jgi:hypothetical protein